MKKTLLLIALSLSFIFVTSAQNFFYGPEGKTFLEISQKKILVKFAEGVGFEQQRQILSKEKLIVPIDEDQLLPKPEITVIELTDIIEEKDILTLLKRLNALDEVLYANYFLLHEDETLHGIMDEIIVKIEKEEDLGPMRFLIEKYATEIVKENKFVPLQYHLKVDQAFELNALQVANALFETGFFEFAEPNFLRIMKRMTTNDPLVDNQWSLQNDGINTSEYNGVAGSDMKVFQAWQTTTGAPGIKIAIIDEGVDLSHPDLAPNMLPGFDATEQGSGGAPSNDDAHGTACAGIAAGVGNNSIGIAGIAYNSKIIPVRIGYDGGSGWITSNEWIGNAINWAWQTAQADVLSNSWGGGQSSNVINAAIDGAVNLGRGGLGAPVLFSAGNGNSFVKYPASYEPTIAVVAMSMCDERKNPSSCDGETWWGSDFGTGADVAAPGVKIYTTDISGSAGYTDGDYTSNFNGTSSACPNAAGVMALVLSLDPSLTEADARTILESSCDKVGGYTYTDFVTGQPSGSWSQELGYGRINAVEALAKVGCDECLQCFDGIQNGDEEGVDCGGSNCAECVPTCNDGKQNGEETGVDCGGPNCPICATCVDGIQNGSETGVDCGGSDCVPCNDCLEQLSFDDFDTDFGIWIDGGSDCRRSSVDAQFSVNEIGASVRLRDNSSSSVVTTSNLNLSGYSRIRVNFSYLTVSMDNANEDFWLQVSTDGGSTFNTVEEWNLGDEFENEIRYDESIEINWTFSASTQFRFRCDASDNGDYVYIDNIAIIGCDGNPVEPTCTDGIQNGQETGVDCGGPDCPDCPTEPTCDDGIQNGQETGVDCGGPDCPDCPTEPTCDDGIQNGQETGVDCG
ncbi:MAG: S8 family serine peptidase, partial [Saprospiraceae bacterium]|nr:S8 family serine peptidase [Saprospiraceae bacterium]